MASEAFLKWGKENDLGIGLDAFALGSSINAKMLTADSYGQIGEEAATADRFTAEQLRYGAIGAEAIGQRRALKRDEEGRLMMSRLAVTAAASGAGGPDVAKFASQIEAKKKENILWEIWNGKTRGQTMNLQADAKELEARNAIAQSQRAASAAKGSIFGDIAKTASSMFLKYNPSASADAAQMDFGGAGYDPGGAGMYSFGQ